MYNKTASVATDYRVEFCQVVFEQTNVLVILARAIFYYYYGHAISSELAMMYYDDLATGQHNLFEECRRHSRQLLETTRKSGLEV